MTSIPDARLEFSALERRVLAWLAVPSLPEVPEGSADSLQVFRAGENFYIWLVLMWAFACVFIGLILLLATFGVTQAIDRWPDWGRIVGASLLVLAWVIYIWGATITFLARRLNFRLRWYIVTDRSLRIRSGVFALKELTMTYRNVQEIRVTAGPIQHAMGLATVEVHAAGGGGGNPKSGGGGGHVGRLEGLSNATEIRDLMIERLRQYRDSGLGEPAPSGGTAGHDDAAAIEAARAVLSEARALRASMGGSSTLGDSGLGTGDSGLEVRGSGL